MDDRIDDYLAQRMPREALSIPERAHADTTARLADDVRTFLSSRPAPDVTDAVMRRIVQRTPAAAPRASFVGRVIRTIWNPVHVSVRPAYAALGAMAVAALVITGGVGAGPDVPAPGGDAPLFVQFRIEATASRVQLMGSFTGWERQYDLYETAPGLWTVTVPLAEGVHDYAFLVDGRQWVADPYASQVNDGFGGINSRLTLLRPATLEQS